MDLRFDREDMSIKEIAGTLEMPELNSSATHAGVRVRVTDLTRPADSTVVDMSTAIESGPYMDSSVVSLDPDQAVEGLAPILTFNGTSGALTPGGPSLPLPVPRLALTQPEFVFGPLPAQAGAATLRLPALQVRLLISAATSIRAQQARTVRLGAAGTVTVDAQLVTPPAGLGLDGTQRGRLTVAFPPADNAGTLQRLSVVVDGVSWVVSRDDPHVDLPQSANPQTIHVTLDNPVVTVRGPWVISLPLPTR